MNCRDDFTRIEGTASHSNVQHGMAQSKRKMLITHKHCLFKHVEKKTKTKLVDTLVSIPTAYV